MQTNFSNLRRSGLNMTRLKTDPPKNYLKSKLKQSPLAKPEKENGHRKICYRKNPRTDRGLQL